MACSRLARVAPYQPGRFYARELPALLSAISAQGREVEDVEVRGPSLQSVFIHLTGRELRE